MSDKDDTKGTPADESERNSKDDSKGTPKKDKGKLYTQAAIDKLKSDAAAMAQGRAEKVAAQEKANLTSELQSTQSRLDALEAQVNEARLAEVRGDPEKLTAYQRDQSTTQRERKVADLEKDLARREGLLKTDRAELDKDRGVATVAYIAAKHGLEVERLEKLGISDLEILERVAEEMKPAQPKGKGDEGDEGGEEQLDLDSGDGSGSGEPTEQERLDARYPTMKK